MIAPPQDKQGISQKTGDIVLRAPCPRDMRGARLAHVHHLPRSADKYTPAHAVSQGAEWMWYHNGVFQEDL